MLNINLKTSLNKKSVLSVAVVGVLVFLMLSSVIAGFTFPVAQVKAQTTSIPSDMLQYEWPQSAHDSSRTFLSAGPGPTTPHIEWRTEIPDFYGVSYVFPVAFNGMVFVQKRPAGVTTTIALDAATGEIVYELYGVGNGGSITKIDDTYMMIGNDCYRSADGSLVWRGPSGFTQYQMQQSRLGYNAELKMVIDGSYAWSLANPAQPPTLLWNRTLESDYGKYGAESIVVYGSGVVVYSTEYGYIRGVNVTTGKTMWTTVTTVSQWMYGSSAIDGVFGRGNLDGNFQAWNITTGELMWTYNSHTFYNQYSVAAASAYGMFYELNTDRHLYAINATTGQKVWSYEGPGVSYPGTVSIADGKVYAQTGENQYVNYDTGEPGHSEFVCLNAYTGEVIWKMPFEVGGNNAMQCIAYGKLYVVPVASQIHSGVHQYAYVSGMIGEVWCIGDTPQDWSMLLNDPVHSSFGDGPTNLALKWTATTGGQVISSPTLANGVLYEGSTDGYIYALNAGTGAQVWNYSTGQIGFSSTVAVVNGKLYTGPDDGNVYCLDAATGSKLWQATASVGKGSPTVKGGMVYVAGGRNLYCFNAFNGALVWNYSAGGAIAGAPAVDQGAVYITAAVAGGGGPNLIKLNATTAAVMFNVDFPGFQGGATILASPTLGAGMVFVRGADRYNYALNASTGAIVWFKDSRYNIGHPSQAAGTDQTSALLYAFGKVYFSDYYGLTAVDALNGSELWHTYLSRESLATGLSYSYGRVYIADEGGVVRVIDALSGAKLSFWQLGAATLHTVPVPYNGSLYLGTLDHNIYCFTEAPLQQILGDTPTLITVTTTPQLQTLGSQIIFSGTVAVNSIGIPVKVQLTATDPNKNYQDIANVTSDDSGFYTATWNPPVSGTYVVTAKFEGDQYFLPSSAKTTFIVTEGAATPSLSVDEIVQKVLAGITSLPAGASADEVAQKVIANLPDNPSAEQIAQEINTQLAANQTLKPAEYSTATIIIIIAVVAALAIGIVNLYVGRKRK